LLFDPPFLGAASVFSKTPQGGCPAAIGPYSVVEVIVKQQEKGRCGMYVLFLDGIFA
jgi:hypothetical protein